MIRASTKFVCRSLARQANEGRPVFRRTSFLGEFPRLNFQPQCISGVRLFGTQESTEDNNTIGIVDLMKEVAKQQQENIVNIVPWFVGNMPPEYFRNVSEKTRIQQLKALTSMNDLGDSDLKLEIKTNLDHGDGFQVTKVTNNTASGALREQLDEISTPDGYFMKNVDIYTTLDHKLALNIYTFQKKEELWKAFDEEDVEPSELEHVFQCIEDVKNGKFADRPDVPKYSEEAFGPEAMKKYVECLRPEYVQYMKTDTRRLLIHKQMWDKVNGTDGASIHFEEQPGSKDKFPHHSISIASSNVLPEVILRLSAAIAHSRNLDIVDARLDFIEDHKNRTTDMPGAVTLLQLVVTTDANQKEDLLASQEFQLKLKRDLKRAKWIDVNTFQLGLFSHPEVGLPRAEVIMAYCSMIHSVLYQKDSQAYASIQSVVEYITRPHHLRLATDLADLFRDRFNPALNLSEEEFQSRSADIASKISPLGFHAGRTVLEKFREAIHATLRTNFFNENRYALSMRIDPTIMFVASDQQDEKKDTVIGERKINTISRDGQIVRKALPFGVFFVHGRHFNAFHCRFRDIARGGLRVVTPSNADQHALESTRLFEEVYGLSYAQQLKNKDIPEGGAKGVILVNTARIKEQDLGFAKRKCVKGFADAMLDLIVEDSVKGLRDFYKKEELIYFGPDEQIINADIDWLTLRAAQRGYPIPAALMSSKADAGFNHKEYGVTSEGVLRYLDVALRRSLKIDPDKESFSVKITGGPDGDVAGNLIKFLYRDYGNNAKVVGVADGFGVAEDPEGLNSEEMLRLINEGLPITAFNRTKLGKDGIMMEANTEEGVTRRNTMCFRVKADAFVPAGGRPGTININNWHNFLGKDGAPSSRLIVEGANIFTTPEARAELGSKAGVAIVKDSSANKCGVITSSNEIAASMLLSKEEFIANKEELVVDVVKRLRELARLEGELLFRTYANYPGNLPHFSERISFAINKVTDALTNALADVQPTDPLFLELLPLIRETFPKKLDDLAHDRISTHLPVQYQRNAIASALASRLVYHEGIHLVESQPDERLAERAIMYYRADKDIKELVQNIPDTDSDWKVVRELLQKGGARSKLGFF